MSNLSAFNKQAFAGTATYYAKYRVPYPAALWDSLLTNLKPNFLGTLVDVGCGTGEVVIPLARYFRLCLGIDRDRGMATLANNHALSECLSNVRILVADAMRIRCKPASASVVTFGASFHWFNRRAAAARAVRVLLPGGKIVILGSNSLWTGTADWQLIMRRVIRKWLGEQRRAGQGYFVRSEESHIDVLQFAGFNNLAEVTFAERYEWSLAELIGHLYSTSFASKVVLGGIADGFEADMSMALLDYDSRGLYAEDMQFFYIVGEKPT